MATMAVNLGNIAIFLVVRSLRIISSPFDFIVIIAIKFWYDSSVSILLVRFISAFITYKNSILKSNFSLSLFII